MGKKDGDHRSVINLKSFIDVSPIFISKRDVFTVKAINIVQALDVQTGIEESILQCFTKSKLQKIHIFCERGKFISSFTNALDWVQHCGCLQNNQKCKLSPEKNQYQSDNDRYFHSELHDTSKLRAPRYRVETKVEPYTYMSQNTELTQKKIFSSIT